MTMIATHASASQNAVSDAIPMPLPLAHSVPASQEGLLGPRYPSVSRSHCAIVPVI